MPDPKLKKDGKSAKIRREEKYIRVLDHEHPHNLNIPIREATQKIQELIDTRNYIKIQTQIDECKYIVQQHYIYCSDDVWCCGDAIVMNQNPEKKILVKVMCTSTRKECIAHDESSHEFITLCPNCKTPELALKSTHFKCPHCGHNVSYIEVNHLPFASLKCAYCPVVTGWELTKKNGDLIKRYLKLRSETLKKHINTEIDGMMKELGE